MDNMVSATQFKVDCLHLVDVVAATHTPLVITKRGRPVAVLSAAKKEKIKSEVRRPTLFGRLGGAAVITGDIVSGAGEAWDAEV